MVRERTGLELDATFPATKLRWVLDQRRRRGGRSPTATWRRGCWHRLAGVHVPTPATPAARCCARSAGATGTTSCSRCSASRARCSRRWWTRTRSTPPIAGVCRAGRGRGPAGVAVRAALLGARRREGHARDRRVRPRAGGEARPAPPGGHPRLVRVAARGRDQLRARGLHPDGRRGAGLVRADRRAARPGRSSTRCCARRRAGSRRLRSRTAGLREPDLGRGRARRRARAEPRHDPRRPRAGGRRRHPPPGRRRGGRDGRGSRSCRVDGGLSRSDWIVQRLADLAGIASCARPAPTRPRSAPQRSPASPRASGRGPRRSRRSRSTSSAEPELAPAARAASASAGPRRGSSARRTRAAGRGVRDDAPG